MGFDPLYCDRVALADHFGFNVPSARKTHLVPQIITERQAIKRGSTTGEFPFYFSSAGRPLYGAFHPASGKKQALVICHPVGTEHILTQRIEVLGARAAANAGIAAFRYNARAHGDSAGDPRGLTFADLVEDACAAADLARELSGASRIIWLGIRLGGLIAAAAISERDDAAAVAFWEPVHCGADYFHSLLRATFFTQLAKGRRGNGTMEDMVQRLETDGEVPVVAGYAYRALYQSVKDATLQRSLDWGGNTLIAQVQRRPTLSADNKNLQSKIEQRGGNVTVACIREEPPWSLLTVAKPQWVSEDLLNVTKEWLDGLE
jgi:alpha/beta superfamily hydrolase